MMTSQQLIRMGMIAKNLPNAHWTIVMLEKDAILENTDTKDLTRIAPDGKWAFVGFDPK